jgi:hypothetical protein
VTTRLQHYSGVAVALLLLSADSLLPHAPLPHTFLPTGYRTRRTKRNIFLSNTRFPKEKQSKANPTQPNPRARVRIITLHSNAATEKPKRADASGSSCDSHLTTASRHRNLLLLLRCCHVLLLFFREWNLISHSLSVIIDAGVLTPAGFCFSLQRRER